MPGVIGLDIAKRVFQLHSVDQKTGAIVRMKLQRPKLLEYFAKLLPTIVAMEACGSSQHWARRFMAMGHELRLIATKFVRPFVKTNKTDAADAAARVCWTSAPKPLGANTSGAPRSCRSSHVTPIARTRCNRGGEPGPVIRSRLGTVKIRSGSRGDRQRRQRGWRQDASGEVAIFEIA
jgi:hypothetical protein